MGKSSPTTPYPHEWLFKAEWAGTAMKFKVGASSLKQAIKRAEGQVSRMEGGPSCLSISMVSQLR